MGNGYKGVAPKLTGRQKLYLELAGVAPSSEAYKNLCDWFVKDWGEPSSKAQCALMQIEMVEQVFPNMMESSELAEYLRQIFPDSKAIMAELIIRRYGLKSPDGECRKMTELAPELAHEYHYTEGTVKTMLSKALGILYRDEHFREALVVPELSDDLFNYWKFVCILLTGSDKRVEQVNWSEDEALAVAKQLQQIGFRNLTVLNESVECWLSTMQEEARMATKLLYGLGYPAIGRSDDYIASASGFGGGQKVLQDFLAVKLNRASFCALFGVEIQEVDYDRLRLEEAINRSGQSSIHALGLPPKASAALSSGAIETVDDLLKIDMFLEENQPWEQYVSSKYWPDVVQLWIDLKIKFEIGEYQFNGGGYTYQNVS